MKKIPKFKNTKEEAEFWRREDSTQYIDWEKSSQAIFPSLKPSTETISLRLPADLLNEIKVIAHKKDIPYQSLIKVMLAQEVNMTRRK